ncbi:Germin-like protein subfamily 1 member 7 [Striga hermonthica]|uniref:Germin-like protein n=1 Tax=Striga hermonthica TaxID=68872 RepID=A0A9N7NGF9_STRHE|nr:Germin-like protein subfamily 1 member 7 [Striga hermonthica]
MSERENVALPKFGSWDVNNPGAAGQYSVIFDRARNEKKRASAARHDSPRGLVHFQFNSGRSNAVAFAGLSSQNPGVITIANAVFGSMPPISVDVLTKAFQVDGNVIKYLQRQFWSDNN